MKFAAIFLTAALAASTLSAAQDAVSSGAKAPPVAPCTLDAGPGRHFDFWIGDWEVVNPQTGQVLGRNVISRRESGCLLLEEWSGASGSTGVSMNFYDAQQEQWRQIWQSAQILVELAGGLDDEGRMVMEGHVHYHAQNQRRPFRGRWTPNDDGSVLQEFWEQRDESRWRPWFTGLYKPAEPATRMR